MTTDFILTAGIDFQAAKQQVDQFVTETKQKYKRLSDIQARANAPGGSNSRPGSSGGSGGSSPGFPRSALDTMRQAIANQRALDAAMNRSAGMWGRIDRQLGGNEAMYRRVSDALNSYTTAIRKHGAGSLEAVKAQGQFRLSMTALNGEIAKQGGLLATLNKGFASNQTAIAGVIRALSGLGAGYSGFGQSMGQSLASMSGFALSASNGAQGASALNGTLRVLTSTTALTVAGFAAVGAAVWAFASATTEAHDRVSLLQQRFTVLAGSTEAGQAAFAALVKSANQMGVGLEDGAQAFSKFIMSGKDLGLTTNEATDLASTFLKLGRIGGSTTAELQSGITQFGQSLAAGTAQGDEFRSMMENTPLVMRAIAKEMGVNVSALKQLSSEGNITAEVMTNALFNAMKDVDAQFAQLPRTASAMTQEIRNNFTLLLDDLDKVFGGSSFVKSVYTTINDLVNSARAKIAPSDDQRATDLETEIAKRRKNIDDRNASFWKSPAFDDQDRQAIARAQKELDDIRKRQADAGQKEREADLQAALQRELNMREKHQKTVADILAKTDPVAKAVKERDDKLKALDGVRGAGVSEADYAKAVAAVNAEYDTAIGRISKRENALSREERAAQKGQKVQDRRLSDLQHEAANLIKLADANMKGADAYAEMARQIQIETRLRELNRSAKEAGIALDEREARAKLEAADAAQRYNDAAAFARNLVDETATPAEKANQRLAELKRNYDELLKSGKPISQEITTAFERAKADAVSSTDVMMKAFKGFAGKAEHFPDDAEANAFFDLLIMEALQ